MILEYNGIKKEEKELRKLFKTTPLHGTYWNFVKEGLMKLNLDFNYAKDQAIETAEGMIKNKTPPVVSINAKIIGGSEDVNHIVVVVGINEKYVTINDPEMGREVEIKRDEFLTAWKARLSRIGYIVRK